MLPATWCACITSLSSAAVNGRHACEFDWPSGELLVTMHFDLAQAPACNVMEYCARYHRAKFVEVAVLVFTLPGRIAITAQGCQAAAFRGAGLGCHVWPSRDNQFTSYIAKRQSPPESAQTGTPPVGVSVYPGSPACVTTVCGCDTSAGSWWLLVLVDGQPGPGRNRVTDPKVGLSSRPYT